MSAGTAARYDGSDLDSSYREWAAPAAATSRVHCLWQQQVGAGSAGHRQRVVPDACADLIVFSTGEAIVAGPTARVQLVDLPAGTHVRGLRLRTAAVASALNCSGRDIADRTVALGDLFADGAARAVAEAVWSGRVPQALSPSAALDRRLEYAVHRLLRDPRVAVDVLADDLHVSTRHLHRLVVQHTGLAPAALRRIGRLQRFLALTDRAGEVTNLARSAVDAGYADHAHLARELRALTDCTPTSLLRERRRPSS